MGDRSVITLQVGHYSNYVGSHFWNIQESQVYNNLQKELSGDVLFREGLTPTTRDVTYLPRLVVVDLKGSLGLLPEFGDLYEDTSFAALSKSKLAAENQLWKGRVAVEKEETKPKNRFLQGLEREERKVPQTDEDKDICETSFQADQQTNEIGNDDIQVWSDFLRMRYHPKTNLILQEYQHGNATRPFDIYGLGVSEAASTQDGYEDRIRFFAEECDYLDGFQILADVDNGFGGYASEMVHYLADDYGSKCRNVFPLFAGEASSEPIQNLGRFLNIGLAIQNLTSDATFVTPMSLAADTFPLRNSYRKLFGLSFQPESWYHTSSILASSLDCLSIPWRMKIGGHRMIDIVSGLNSYGRKVGSLCCSLPFPFERSNFDSLAHMLKESPISDNPFDLVSLTPSVDYSRDRLWMEAISIRGLERHLKPPKFSLTDPKWQKEYSSNIYLRSDTLKQALLCYFTQHWPDCKMGVSSTDSGLPISPPYPSIFASPPNSGSVDILTSWYSSHGTGSLVKKMADRMSKINLGKLHRFVESGLESDEMKEVVEELYSLEKCYDPDKYDS